MSDQIKSKLRRKIYNNFMIAFDGQIPLEALVPNFVLYGILEDVERDVIDLTPLHPNKIKKLFGEYMPGKDDEIHIKLIKVFRAYKYNDFADYLDKSFANMSAMQQTTIPDRQTTNQATAGAMTANTQQSQAGASTAPKQIKGWSAPLEMEWKALRQAETALVDNAEPLPVDQAPTNDDAYYPFDPDHKQVFALIINISDFKRTNMPDRIGSERDVQQMKELFTFLKYDVRVVENLEAEQILAVIRQFAQLLEVNLFGSGHYNSCVIVLMSHGDNGKLYGVDGKTVEEQEIFNIILQVKQLIGRPKIFFIQACRGTAYDWGFPVHDGGDDQEVTPDTTAKIVDAVKEAELRTREAFGRDIKKIPVEADLYVLHSTTPGYFSWRDMISGSWFVQAIYAQFSKYAYEPHEDLFSLSTRVQNHVAKNFKGYGQLLQMPEMTSRMTKRFRFREH